MTRATGTRKRRSHQPEPGERRPEEIDTRADQGLVFAGVAMLTLAFFGIASTVSSNAGKRPGAGGYSPMAESETPPAQEMHAESDPAAQPTSQGAEYVLTGSGEPE